MNKQIIQTPQFDLLVYKVHNNINTEYFFISNCAVKNSDREKKLCLKLNKLSNLS